MEADVVIHACVSGDGQWIRWRGDVSETQSSKLPRLDEEGRRVRACVRGGGGSLVQQGGASMSGQIRGTGLTF